ncbi:MAG: VOC family protein [Acidimicrobiales bacterium]
MPFTIALPIADRRASFDFYRQALRLNAVGPVADDGVPEPLAFDLVDGVQLMLIPADGFAWVIGEHVVTERGQTECLLDVAAHGQPEVDDLVDRVRSAGGRVLEDPQSKPWGYCALFADPDGHLWTTTAPLE